MLFLSILSLVGGLALLIKGADWLVEGGSSLARRLGMSDLMIGLTIVAFGTSMPELVVNILSSVQGANDLAIGNIVGSNISNILLILGVGAIIAPIHVQHSTVTKEIPFSLLAALMVFTMANDRLIDLYPLSELGRSDGLTFLGFFLIFLWYTFGMRHNGNGLEEEVSEVKRSLSMASLMSFGGIALLVAGGRFAVEGAIDIAESLGLSQALIGLTVVAIGTSLPELVTTIVAGMKKKIDLAVGNIVGSNIFNVFWILGTSAVISPLTFESSLNVDLLVAIAATVLLFFVVHTGPTVRRFVFWRQHDGHVITRSEGILMVGMYVVYTAFVVWRG